MRAHRPSLSRGAGDNIVGDAFSLTTTRELMTQPPPGIAKLFQGVVSRLIAYYSTLVAIVWVTWTVLSLDSRQQVAEALAPILGMGGGSLVPATVPGFASGGSLVGLPPHLVTLLAAVACVAAVLLTLPVAWVYMFTRQKKGYSQSVVHTLVLLPAVVAAVAVLVRNNIALAFSLAGIVAAVRFRTTLEDSKDAVYVFVVSALGLACGVQLEVAIVLSLLYIVLALVLWQTDFARTPPSLEGKRAEEHMQRAIAIANRTSEFVARVDREILETLAPEQLEALAGRVRKRREDIGTPAPEGEEDRPKFDGRLTIAVSAEAEARAAIEIILTTRAKRFELVRSETAGEGATLVYAVRARKGMRLDELAGIVEREGVPFVSRAKAEQWM